MSRNFVTCVFGIVLATSAVLIAHADGAVDDVRRKLSAMGYNEGFDSDAGRIVGIGVAYSPKGLGIKTVEELPWKMFVDAVRSAHAKALRNICRDITSDMSAERTLQIQNVNGVDRQILSKTYALRTSGRPMGARTIARSWKLNGNELEVAVAIFWSETLEREMLDALLNPKAVDELELEEWAKSADFVSLLGDGIWRGRNGAVCFVGVGAAEAKSTASVAISSAMRAARRNSQKCVIYSLMGNLLASEKLVKTTTDNDNVNESNKMSSENYEYEILRRAKGMMMPGFRHVHEASGLRFVSNGGKIYWCISAFSAADASAQIHQLLGKSVK